MADSGRIYNAPASLKSKVWKKFRFYLKNGVLDKSVAICKDCKTALKYTDSTTNLHAHLVRRHGETGEEEAGTASAKTPTEMFYLTSSLCLDLRLHRSLFVVSLNLINQNIMGFGELSEERKLIENKYDAIVFDSYLVYMWQDGTCGKRNTLVHFY